MAYTTFLSITTASDFTLPVRAVMSFARVSSPVLTTLIVRLPSMRIHDVCAEFSNGRVRYVDERGLIHTVAKVAEAKSATPDPSGGL